MSLSIKHLNGDTTFLLTFSPIDKQSPSSSPSPSCLPSLYHQQPSGTFSILVDPWLSGPSTMWHPKFLYSKHTVPSCIQHLSEIPEPNVVLVSQDKPDHCHESTLRQLNPSSTLTTILAEPAAAKRIKGMKHFNPSNTHALPVYSDRRPESIIRFYIPPITPGGVPGEATITFIPAKLDMSGLHNAIGITYRPPTAAYLPVQYMPLTPLPQSNHFVSPDPHPQTLPLTPPDSPDLVASDLRPTTSPVQRPRTSPNVRTSIFSNRTASTISTPLSSSGSNPSHASVSSISSIISNRPHMPAEKTLSVIYSPHGISYPLIRPYASSHLVSSAALPLTALLHSFDRVQNPWWMGGNVNAGLPGGVEIAKNLMAKCWISAHDEDKENTGLAVRKVATRKYTAKEVREMVGDRTDVEVLATGAEKMLKA